jgi:hypothetical protein
LVYHITIEEEEDSFPSEDENLSDEDMADELTQTQRLVLDTLTLAEDQMIQVENLVVTDNLVHLDFHDMAWNAATLNLSILEETIVEIETVVEQARKAKAELQKVMIKNSTDEKIQQVRPRYPAADNRTRAARVVKRQLQAKCVEEKARIRQLDLTRVTPAALCGAYAAGPLQVKLPQIVMPKFGGEASAF